MRVTLIIIAVFLLLAGCKSTKSIQSEDIEIEESSFIETKDSVSSSGKTEISTESEESGTLFMEADSIVIENPGGKIVRIYKPGLSKAEKKKTLSSINQESDSAEIREVKSERDLKAEIKHEEKKTSTDSGILKIFGYLLIIFVILAVTWIFLVKR